MEIRETKHLTLTDDGSVYLKADDDEYGESDVVCLGDVEDCWRRVPGDYQIEFEELEEAWEVYQHEASACRAGAMHDYYSTRGV